MEWMMVVVLYSKVMLMRWCLASERRRRLNHRKVIEMARFAGETTPKTRKISVCHAIRPLTQSLYMYKQIQMLTCSRERSRCVLVGRPVRPPERPPAIQNTHARAQTSHSPMRAFTQQQSGGTLCAMFLLFWF